MADRTDLTYRSNSTDLVPGSRSEDPDMIQRQIDHTRTQLGVTIQEIGERLSPENLIEQAKTSAREATVGRMKDMKNEANRKIEVAGSSLSDTIRDNPLPVAIIGLGLGWLFLSERNKRDIDRSDAYRYGSDDYRYYSGRNDGPMEEVRSRVGDVASAAGQKTAHVKHQVSGAVQDAGESVAEMADRAGDAVTDTAHRVGDTLSDAASRLGDSVSHTASRVGEKAEMLQERVGEMSERTQDEAERLRREAEYRSRMALNRTKQSLRNNMEENPFALGAVLAIAGVAIGAAIPATEYENKLLGETRDRFVDEAKLRAQDAVERVQTVFEDTQRAAVTEAKDAVRRQNLTIDDDKNNGNENSF